MSEVKQKTAEVVFSAGSLNQQKTGKTLFSSNRKCVWLSSIDFRISTDI